MTIPNNEVYDRPDRQRRALATLSSYVTAVVVPVRLASHDRIAWRVSALCLVLSACRGKSAQTEQLHVLMWAMRDRMNAQRLGYIWEGLEAGHSLRAYEPLLNDTLRLSEAGGLVVSTATGRWKLTPHGSNLTTKLEEMDVFSEERAFLVRLGPISTSEMWRRLASARATNSNMAERL